MLIDINLKPNYVKETVAQRRNLLKYINANSSQRKFLEKSIENTLAIRNISDLFDRFNKGIYKGIVYDSYLKNITGLNLCSYKKGIADDINQILIKFKKLVHSNDRFVIIFDKLNKTIKDIEEVKYTEYIGNSNLKDNKNFKKALYFNIFILEEEAKVS